MYIGLDIGTSGTKAALIGNDGIVVDFYQISYQFSNTTNGYRELDADEVWNAVKTCLIKVGYNQRIKTITVSALGEAIILIDKAGKALCPSITGTDRRGTEESEALSRRLGSSYLTDITGLNLSAIYSANKICWLLKYKNSLYKKAWKIVSFQDFVVYRLTQEAFIDFSMASRTLLFDITENDWSEVLLKALGIDRSKLSTPIRGGSIVGKVKADIAGELGISSAAQIVIGTHDHISNAIGSGVVHYGDCANTVGTTEGLTALVKREQLTTENISKYQISCQPFVLPNIYNTVAWNNTSGALLRWFAEKFVRDNKDICLIDIYEKLNSTMCEEPTRLLVLPHFSGAATPYMDSRSKGAILGLTLNTGRNEIYKALMEGANYELVLMLDCLKNAGFNISKLVATGGALSRKLLQIKADILGMEVHTVKNKQTGTLGGAILGAVAIGDFTNISEAVQNMVKEAEIYEPDRKRRKIYQEQIMIYKDTYKALFKINHKL